MSKPRLLDLYCCAGGAGQGYADAGFDVIGVYGGHIRNRRRVRTIGVYGEGVRDSRRKFDKGVPDFSIEQGREAMGIDWMTTAELSQAIPPAYTKFLGEHLMRVVREERAAA